MSGDKGVTRGRGCHHKIQALYAMLNIPAI